MTTPLGNGIMIWTPEERSLPEERKLDWSEMQNYPEPEEPRTGSPPREHMLVLLQYDLKRYFHERPTLSGIAETLLLTPGIWVTVLYRIGNRTAKIRNPFVRKAFMVPLRILHLLISVPVGIDISFDTTIGKGFYIGHHGGIVVNGGVEIGRYCNISQGVSIGLGGRGEQAGCPKIGHRVYIGPGAKVFGNIRIGNDVAIGANAVVLKDVPDRAVVGGIPAVILNFKSSSDFIVGAE